MRARSFVRPHPSLSIEARSPWAHSTHALPPGRRPSAAPLPRTHSSPPPSASSHLHSLRIDSNGSGGGNQGPWKGPPGQFGGWGSPGQEKPWVNPDAMPPGDTIAKFTRDITELARKGKVRIGPLVCVR